MQASWSCCRFVVATAVVLLAATALTTALIASRHHARVLMSISAGALLLDVAIVATVHCTQRQTRRPVARRTRLVGIGAGLASYFGAWMVIWAMTVAPIPLVSALQETSIVFAVVIGLAFFNERLNLARLTSMAATLLGAVILKVSR